MPVAALALPPGPDSGTDKPPQEQEQGHSGRRKRARSGGKEQRDVNIRGRYNKERISLHLAGGPNPPVDAVEEEKGVTLDSLVPCITEGAGEHEVAEIQALDPATHAFSLAIRECQNRRRECKGLVSDASAMERMKKSSAVSARGRRSGVCPSPGSPSYRHGGTGFPKGWSSERVPLPAGTDRRNGSGTTLVRIGNGRTLPSKWEDAEKWICSPVSVEAVGIRHPALPPNHRRPKSKSGPVGSSAGIIASYANSPLVAGFDGKGRTFVANSPFSTGVLMANGGCCSGVVSGLSGGAGRSSSVQSEQSVVLSASMHGWSDMVESSCSLPSSHGSLLLYEKADRRRDTSTAASPEISRKDVATQMSPGDSSQSSPRGVHSPPPTELQSHFSKLEVRDVQVDDCVTVTRWSKKQVARGLDKGSTSIVQWKKKTVESKGSAWEVTEIEKSKCMSKLKKEEASITAWENLQKAKAESEIRKLEMKLEKKRSSSMDKILNKLKSAQRKAQEMRIAVTENQAQLAASTANRTMPFRRVNQFGYLSGCFSCHAF